MSFNRAYADPLYRRNRLIVLAASGGKCSVPGCTRLANTADHIVPLELGGWHELENLRPMCGFHNSSRSMQELNRRRREKKNGRRSREW